MVCHMLSMCGLGFHNDRNMSIFDEILWGT